MSKCPVYLRDCEKHAQVDSVELEVRAKQIESLNTELYLQKEKTKKANRRTLIGTLFGVLGGVITMVLIM